MLLMEILGAGAKRHRNGRIQFFTWLSVHRQQCHIRLPLTVLQRGTSDEPGFRLRIGVSLNPGCPPPLLLD
jgi:hypothetical protein